MLHLRGERLATRHILHASRRLDQLLEKLGHSSSSTKSQPVEQEVMARLFGTPEIEAEGSTENVGHLTVQIEDKLTQIVSS